MATSQQDEGTLAEKNQKFWNTRAQDLYQTQWVKDLQQQISSHLLSNLDWIGIKKEKQGKMLDYACGHGIASQLFSPYFDTCSGIDVSEGMVETYNAKAREIGLTETQMHAVHGDLTARNVDPSLQGEKWTNFDLATISMALHHLEDPFEGVKKLVERLREGGTLLVIDWATVPKAEDDGGAAEQQGSHNHEHQHGHGHHNGHQHHHDHSDGKASHAAAHTMLHDSFSKEQMEKAFKDAGCDHFDFVLHPETSIVAMGGREQRMRLFFGRGRRSTA